MKDKIKKTVIFGGYSCNNRCVFCFNEEKRGRLEDMTTEEIKSKMANARRRGSTYLELIGGEPTIRHDIIELVKFSKKLGFETIMLSTNGRMFSYSEFAKKIIRAGLNHIVFSIHGHTPELHDSMTNVHGSFKELVKGVSNVKELGFDNIGSNTTIVRQNYKFLPEIGKFILDLGIRNSEFIFVDPTRGGAKNDFYGVVPRISEVAPFVRKCLEIGSGVEHWDIRYYPLCYLNGYENQVSELKEVKRFRTEHIAIDFENPDVETSRSIVGRAKTEKCITCKRFKICEGVWKEYLKRYGDDELMPVEV